MGAGCERFSHSGFPCGRVNGPQQILREMMRRATLDTISFEALSLLLLISKSGGI